VTQRSKKKSRGNKEKKGKGKREKRPPVRLVLFFFLSGRGEGKKGEAPMLGKEGGRKEGKKGERKEPPTRTNLFSPFYQDRVRKRRGAGRVPAKKKEKGEKKKKEEFPSIIQFLVTGKGRKKK